MSCEAVTANKKTHFVRSYVFPESYDFTGFEPEMRIAASEGASPLLTINTTETANGSIAQAEGRSIIFTVTPADLQSLPNGSPVSSPWVGVFEADVTAPTYVISLLEKRVLSVEKGV